MKKTISDIVAQS